MEQTLISRLKKLFLLALGARVLSSVYYGVKIVGAYREVGPMDFSYGVRSLTMTMAEYGVTEIIYLGILLVGLRFLFKNFHQEWAIFAVIISLLILLPSWSAPFCIYGLYLIYKESKQVQSWIADFKVN